MRRATIHHIKDGAQKEFQSTLSVRRATVKGSNLRLSLISISIHALREESDEVKRAKKGQSMISIHALREESDKNLFNNFFTILTFQSTLSVRRATILSFSKVKVCKFQSTLSVRRATSY